MKRMKVIYIFFVFFLTGIIYEPFNENYILLKKSISASSIPYILFYAIELAVLITVIACMFKLTRNVEKKIIFERINLRILRVVGIALCTPMITQFIGEISGILERATLVGDAKIWMAGAMFALIISEVFKKGIELKEEQEMVI